MKREYFTREIETIKKNETEILKLELNKWDLKSILNTADHLEERISDLKDRNLEIILVEEQK